MEADDKPRALGGVGGDAGLPRLSRSGNGQVRHEREQQVRGETGLRRAGVEAGETEQRTAVEEYPRDGVAVHAHVAHAGSDTVVGRVRDRDTGVELDLSGRVGVVKPVAVFHRYSHNGSGVAGDVGARVEAPGLKRTGGADQCSEH